MAYYKVWLSQNKNGLLEYIPGSRSLLVQKNSSVPLEGFAENISESICDYVESAKVSNGTLFIKNKAEFLSWI